MERPYTTPFPEACKMLGISRQTGYNLEKAGKFPVPIIRLGKRRQVPTAPLLKFLGVEDEQGEQQPVA